MIDIKLVREHPELVKENIRKKFQEEKIPLVDKVLELDKQWREEKGKGDKLRSERNKLSQKINELKKEKKENEAKKLILQAKEIPQKIDEQKKKTQEMKVLVDEALLMIPNMIHESVPLGKGEEDNNVIETIGEAKIPSFEIQNHAELAEQLGGLNQVSSRKTSGQGFYFLQGDLALLHSALLSYARDFMIEKGFSYTIVPNLIRREVVSGVMSFEDIDAMMYKIEDEDLYLIGTSEHSLIGMYREKVLQKNELPQTVTAYSACYRKEKGSHGIEEKGLFRVHQFEKQEMVVVCEPAESYAWFEKLVSIAKEFWKNLGIPIQILEMCSGDLGDLKSKQIDIEAWSPRQKKYYEVGSCSNLTDAQSRRMGIKINGGQGNYFAHTLNNTVVASPRALIAILENYQQKDGTVTIPKVLQPYMKGTKKLTKKNSVIS